jgi:hypothetical protein
MARMLYAPCFQQVKSTGTRIILQSTCAPHPVDSAFASLLENAPPQDQPPPRFQRMLALAHTIMHLHTHAVALRNQLRNGIKSPSWLQPVPSKPSWDSRPWGEAHTPHVAADASTTALPLAPPPLHTPVMFPLSPAHLTRICVV